MPWLRVGDENGVPIEIHYDDYGDGRPVVLIPGWPLGSRAWEHQLPPLVDAGYRVITYDRRGAGRSSRPWRGYDYDTLAADLHTLITRLDLTDAALLGTSTGSGQVVRYVRTYGSGRLRRLAFISPPPPYLYRSYDNPNGRFDDQAIAELATAIRRDRLAFLDHHVRAVFRGPGETSLVSEAQHAFHVSGCANDSPKGTLDFLQASIYTDFRTDLEHISTAVLTVHGADDEVFPIDRQMHQAIPGSRLVVVPGAPHALNVTHPDPVNRALLAFLND